MLGYVGSMVTIHRDGNLRVVIFSNDHALPHVHVFIGDGQAKINLLDRELVWVRRMKRTEVRTAIDLVATRQREFLERWEEIHG